MPEEGFKRAGNGKDGITSMWLNLRRCGRDVKASIDRLKPREALYIGGMGHKDKNFHKDMFVRRGYKDEADRIQELYLAGHKEEAIATVPDEWIDLEVSWTTGAHQGALPGMGGFRRQQLHHRSGAGRRRRPDGGARASQSAAGLITIDPHG